MAYRMNPFLERMSEKTTSDQEFVRLFSPKILERLPDDAFESGVHIFRSPPGGGKTTLLRAFTPSALRAFWNARRSPEMSESYQRLVARGVLDEKDGRPQLLSVFLSCASGYADLPPGATIEQEGLFRALLDCRIVLRTLRSLSLLLGYSSADYLDSIKIEYGESAKELKAIPLITSARELANWAEQRERSVYSQLDSIAEPVNTRMPAHMRFEGVLWLHEVKFLFENKVLAPRRMLMIDDLHKLRRKQRALLIDELSVLRPPIPIWLAERTFVLGEELLLQGARQGRDLALDDLWVTARGQHQFTVYAQNILDRRLDAQNAIPPGAFSQYMRAQFQPDEIRNEIDHGIEIFHAQTQRHKQNPHYTEWLAKAEGYAADHSFESLLELYSTRILIARNEGKRQMVLDLSPLPAQALDERDSSQVHGAAEIFAHEELKIPYYFGIERLCIMATNNVEELLALAAELYQGLQAKLVLRRPELLLSPHEQEKLLKGVAERKRDFISKAHTEGTRARRLLDAIGAYCRNKTFQSSAPIAPGVTGVRLSQPEITKLHSKEGPLTERSATLRKVISECVAENLLVARQSAATTSRDSGTVFYLNRTLCAYYRLPLQMGGWQDVGVDDLTDWMEHSAPDRHKRLEME